MFKRMLMRFGLVTVREYCDAVETAFDRGYRLGTAWGQSEGLKFATTYTSPAEALAEEAVASGCRWGCCEGPSGQCLWVGGDWVEYN